MKKSLSTILVLCHSLAFAGQEIYTIPSFHIKKLEISNPKGRITVNPLKNGQPTITIVKKKFTDKCKIETQSSDESAYYKIEYSSIFERTECVTDMLVEIPEGISLEISTGDAETQINTSLKDLNFSSASANLTAFSDIKNFEGKTASGSVEIKNISGNANFKTASGNLILNYQSCDSRIDIENYSASGDMIIAFPPKCKIKNQFKSVGGSIYNELGDSEDNLVLITFRSAGGDLKIKKRK